ncbi:MAG: leucyl/phenylalanyl-tRNA--protein transferase, partial [Spirochaetota bacterium]
VGGIYGVAIGRMFFAESMFSLVSNASKAALISLCRFLDRHAFRAMDAQLHTPHVSRMGGREIPRGEFLRMVAEAVRRPGIDGSWRGLLTPGDTLARGADQ